MPQAYKTKNTTETDGVMYSLKDQRYILSKMKDIFNCSVDFSQDSISLGTIPKIYLNLFDIADLDLAINMRHAYNQMATKKKALADNMYRKGEGDDYHEMGYNGLTNAIISVADPLIIMDADVDHTSKKIKVSVILSPKETNELLFGVLEFYDNRRIESAKPERGHAILTIFDKASVDNYIAKAIKGNRVLYINKKHNLTGIPVDQSDSNLKDYVLKKNLSRFNEKIKSFKEKNKISDEILLLKKQQSNKTSSDKTDADYLDAVNNGDTEAAQKMVDEAAKKAGYDKHLYHGTNADFIRL